MDAINSFIGVIKPVAELLYFVSGIGLSIFAYYGLQQIAVLKSTSSIQAKRDALRLTSEQCSLYFEKIIPLQNEFYKTLKEKKVTYFDGWSVQIINGGIRASRKSPPNTEGFLELAPRLAFLNNMEAFSVYFVSRVADERIAYDALGKTFVNTCETIMPWILSAREDGYYKNIVALFALWKVRLDKEILLEEKNTIEKRLAASKSSFQSPIGTDQA